MESATEPAFDFIDVNGVRLSKEDLAEAYRAFQRFDKDGSGAIDTKVMCGVTGKKESN